MPDFSKFYKFLMSKVPDWDKEILKDRNTAEMWFLPEPITPVSGQLRGKWWDVREHVRKLSEGLAYK